MTDTRLASVRLQEKFKELRETRGLQDVKFWYLPSGDPKDASVEDVAEEVLEIVEAYATGAFSQIPKHKLQ